MSAIHRRVLKAANVSVVVQPLARNEANGALTSYGTALTVTGRAGGLTVNRKYETERVDADDMTGADRDWSKADFTLTIEALKLASGSAVDLEDVFDVSPFVEVYVHWTRGGVNRPRYWYGIVEEFSWEKGVVKNIDRLTISRIDIGASNPATSSQA
jgi:hypothetical protein